MYANDAVLTTTNRIIRDRGGFALHIYPYFFRLRRNMPNLLVKMDGYFKPLFCIALLDDCPRREVKDQGILIINHCRREVCSFLKL